MKVSTGHPSNLSFITAETKESNNLSLKRKYINQLQPDNLGPSGLLNFDTTLLQLPVDTLQALHLSLGHVFTNQCSNYERGKIINCLLGVNQDQWEVLLKQVCFIMPVGTRGHDVAWATEILSSVVDPAFREKLTHVANRLFKYDTLTVERGYILEAVAQLDSEALSDLDKANEKTRDQFVANHVPASLKKGARKAYVYDSVLGKGWKV